MTSPAPEGVGARIEELLSELLGAGPEVAARAEELVGLVVRMYGEALGRITELVDEPTLRSLAQDPTVAGILVLHDLHPVPLSQRVHEALERVRPYLGSHAGGVELVEITGDGVVHLRLQGSCDGCPASTITVTTAIESAIRDAAPEVVEVEVEGVSATPARGQETSVSLGPTRRSEPSSDTWIVLGEPLPRVGEVSQREVEGIPVLLAATSEHVYAYRHLCPGCGAELADGELAGTVLTCPGCSLRYDLAAAGRCLSGDRMLEPVPLLIEEGSARVAMGAVA